MARNRPFGITLLAILAGIAGLVAVWYTLQMLHLVPISGPFGVYRFFTFDILGALLWGGMAAIWFWVMRMLWQVNPQGWLFVTVLAMLNLIMAVLSILGQSTLEAMLPSLVVNGIVLLYCLLPGTKASFGVP